MYSVQNIDEHALVEQSLNGDHRAYGELVDRYKNALYHHCFAIVRDEDVAEDLAQETFITAYYKLHLYKPQYRLSTWLFKIATNKALTWLKKASREIAATSRNYCYRRAICSKMALLFCCKHTYLKLITK
jgi:DNA-directed RNA polymerase specialized sigma24 family protein